PTDSKPERITKLLKEQAKTLNFNDIEFPIDLKGIDKFEKQNNIFINVIGYENKHININCNNNDPDNIVMPEKGVSIQFKNYQREMKVPFVVYADFESILKPIYTCEPNPEESFTNIYQRPIPIGFCYYIKSDFME
ncbi:hypothetical protein CAPTEDRAFT_79965, partial [Capitella teleta]